jgi:hypothetical protein
VEERGVVVERAVWAVACGGEGAVKDQVRVLGLVCHQQIREG